MRPFLLISIREEQAAADDELDAFQRFLGLGADGLVRHRLGLDALDVELDAWSGILLGGGPYTYSDDRAGKSSAQLRAESDVGRLLDRVVEVDFPFLGACYGIGTLGSHQGGLVDRSHPEPVGPLSVTLTEAGALDPLFAGVPQTFSAYGGHKESLARLPDSATCLATSASCPVQAFRVGAHVYATQFHPELDLAGLHTRIDTYATFGYFEPSEADSLRAAGTAVEVLHPMRLLANFAERYRR